MNEKDLVAEARELLSRLSDWPNSIPDIKHALFADAVERERDSPFFGCSGLVADLYARAPTLLSTLCDEVERLREQWNTRFSALCGNCGKRYPGPRDEHLHGIGICGGTSNGE